MRCAAWWLVLAACTLDTSGVGEGESTGGSGGSSGSGPTTTATTTTMTTTAPTTGATETTTTEPTSTDPSTGSDPTSADGSESSTGDQPLGAFGEATPIDELNTAAIEDDPTLRSDMLEIFFSRSVPTQPWTEDIYRATRASADDPFDMPELVDELSIDNSADASPELSSDGLVLSFSGAWPGGPGGNDVMITYRDDWNSPWSDPVRIDELTTDWDDAALSMTENMLVGYYCHDFGGAAYWDLMRTTRSASDDPWDDGTPLDAINGDGRDCSPWVDAQETELWFTTTRPGGMGAEDIWRVAIEGGRFATPAPVEELNSMQADEDPWLSPDGHTIVFASNRPATDYDIWTATR